MLVESATPQLKEIAAVGASFADPSEEHVCEAFRRQVAMLEGALRQTFRAATLMAKKSGELEEVADIWKRMSGFCDSVSVTLSSLKTKYPDCGTPELCDLALGYEQACEDRLRNVQEEIQCQRIELPKGMLPELS